MNFASDNTSGVCPEIQAALERAAAGFESSYGEDAWTARLAARFAEVFEHDVSVFPVVSGTAANALALASLVPPWGAVLCHENAHIHTDESGAPELATGGAKLLPLPGAHGKLAPERVRAAFDREDHGVHSTPIAALSFAQASESGTVYSADETRALSAAAAAGGAAVHLDGARFANAVAASGASPAALSWRAGVDVLSFGATKNGAWAAEAVVFFDPARVGAFERHRKRSGHLLSKMRFVSAQLEAYLADDLWLRNARHANAMAKRLADGLGAVSAAKILSPVDANEVFVAFPETVAAALEARGARFFGFAREGQRVARLVTSFCTPPEDVDRFLGALGDQ